jgi:predicted porin
MNKKLMALAVAGAFGVPAAAVAQVEIYGRANVFVDSYSATGSAAAATDFKSRTRVNDQGSRLGVRGREDLGRGLRAVYQIESGVNIDTGSNQTSVNGGPTNPSASTFATRDSWVGVEGGWGRVLLGRQSLYYGNGIIEQVTSNYVNVGLPLFSGNLIVPSPTARTSNVLSYTTPIVNGVDATVAISPQSEGTQAAGAAGNNTDGRITALTARYTGRVNAQLDWAKNKKQTPLPPAGNGDQTGVKLGVGYPYAPGAQIALVYVSQKLENLGANLGPATAGDTIKAKGWGINWEAIFGNIQALAQYARVNDLSGCTGDCSATKANMYMVGAKYLFTKRTGAYATFNQIKNDTKGFTDFSNGGGYTPATNANLGTAAAGLPAASAGADPRVIALGIMHNF